MHSLARKFLFLLVFGFTSNSVFAAASPQDWQTALNQAIKSVVRLQLVYQRSVDTEMAGSSTATGFVVDAQRGIIMSNRHVSGSGPIIAKGTFDNNQQLPLEVIYRDPVHDFAFFRYDTNAFPGQAPPALKLAPEKINVGQSIRVIGADGGEQLSILSGIIAKLDRAAPNYGAMRYNDYNTFYIQAASSTSGGSSGSPVINIDGEVVALNAGANSRTAASFYLPLYSAISALEAIADDRVPDRGSLDVVFQHRSLSELARYGLDQSALLDAGAHEKLPRGLLVVDRFLVGSEAKMQLKVGDMLVDINAKPIGDFQDLESILNAHVGDEVRLRWFREGQLQSGQFAVLDLQKNQLNRFVEIGNTLLQALPNTARLSYTDSEKGVFVANAGYIFSRAGVPRYSVIVEINDQKIDNLDDLLAVLGNAHAYDILRIRYVDRGGNSRPKPAFVELSSNWFEPRQCVATALSNRWDCKEFKIKAQRQTLPDPSLLSMVNTGDPQIDAILPRLVRVNFDIPKQIDNILASQYSGWGLIVDEKAGLIIADRNTVPTSLGDIRVNLLDTVDVKAQVVMLHPRHNFALLKIDPQWLSAMDWPPLKLGRNESLSAPVNFVGFDLNTGLFKRQLDRVEPYALEIAQSGYPRFLQVPVDLYQYPALSQSIGGLLFDQQGVVVGIHGSYAVNSSDGGLEQVEAAAPAIQLVELLDRYRNDKELYDYGFFASYDSLSRLAIQGVGSEYLQALRQTTGLQRRAPVVRAIKYNSQAAQALQIGDVILEVSGEAIRDYRDLDRAANDGYLSLKVWRSGQAVDVSFPLESNPPLGSNALLSWKGALIQSPPSETRYFQRDGHSQVYITAVVTGSPAEGDGLFANQLITAVNSQPVTTVENFMQAVRDLKGDVVLNTVDIFGRERVQVVGEGSEFSSTRYYEQTKSDKLAPAQWTSRTLD